MEGRSSCARLGVSDLAGVDIYCRDKVSGSLQRASRATRRGDTEHSAEWRKSFQFGGRIFIHRAEE
jgi:hypothetical protein